MKYEAVIFDLDGTLLDSIDDIRDSVNHTMTALGLPEISREQALARVGNGSGRLIELCVPGGRDGALLEPALSEYSRWYAAHCLIKTKPYDGILELLAALGERGVKCAIVSNKPDEAVRSIAERFFSGLVLSAVGERPGVRRKPAPDTILKAALELGAAPEKCVYVGDTEVDIMSARNAGMDCVTVLWGFRSREELIDAGAAVFAETPGELLERLT